MNAHTTVALVAANMMVDLSACRPPCGRRRGQARLVRIDILAAGGDQRACYVRKVYDSMPDVIEQWRVSSCAAGTRMPAGLDSIRTGMGATWMVAGATIYQESGNTLTRFSRLEAAVTMDARSLLCLSSNEIINSRYDDSGSEPAAASMMASGRYCADHRNQELYTITIAPGTLRHVAVRIIPL